MEKRNGGWLTSRPLKRGTFAKGVRRRAGQRRTRSTAAAVDSSSTGAIAFQPGVDAASATRAQLEESARALLRYLDVNFDGKISQEEMSLLEEFSLPGEKDKIFQALDPDASGTVDMDVFWARFLLPWIAKDPAAIGAWLQRQWHHVSKGTAQKHDPVAARYPLPTYSPPPAPADSLHEAWDNFKQAIALDHIMAIFEDLCAHLDVDPSSRRRTDCCGCRSKPFWFLERLSNQLGLHGDCVPALQARCGPDDDRPLRGRRVAVVGAGPVGLRSAVELALLGAEVDVFDARVQFNRMNVLKLWGWAAYDLLSLGVKTLLPVFLVYRDIIGIQELQAFLVKVCLLLGVKTHFGTELRSLDLDKSHWMLTTEDIDWSDGVRKPSGWLDTVPFSAVVAADGGASFQRGVCKEVGITRVRADGLDSPLDYEIAVVVNFHNAREPDDRATAEMPRWFDPRRLTALDPRVKCTQIIYLAGNTHYFIMTVVPSALVEAGVFRDPSLPIGEGRGKTLTSFENVDKDRLEIFARIVATCYSSAVSSEGKISVAKDFWARRHIAQDVFGKPALATFAYASTARRASTPLLIPEKNGPPVLVVGDALREPFWPKGEGCGRGFLGALDTAWVLGLWAAGLDQEALIVERQKLFELEAALSSVSKYEVMMPYCDSETFESYSYLYTLDPATRYKVVHDRQAQEEEDEDDEEDEEQGSEDEEVSDNDGDSDAEPSCTDRYKACAVQ